jgi:hypothetical protein
MYKQTKEIIWIASTKLNRVIRKYTYSLKILRAYGYIRAQHGVGLHAKRLKGLIVGAME